MAEIPLSERIERLEDIEEIRQLKAAYCAACDDDHNGERVAALFLPDGVWEASDGSVHAVGRPAIREFMDGVRRNGGMRNCAHMVMNPVIEVDGERARGAWRLQMMFTGHAEGDSLQYHRIIGHYVDEYVKRDGRWLFQKLCVTVEESGPYSVEPSRLVRGA